MVKGLRQTGRNGPFATFEPEVSATTGMMEAIMGPLREFARKTDATLARLEAKMEVMQREIDQLKGFQVRGPLVCRGGWRSHVVLPQE